MSYFLRASIFTCLVLAASTQVGCGSNASAGDGNSGGGDPGTGTGTGTGTDPGDSGPPAEEPCGASGTLDTAFGKGGFLVSEASKSVDQTQLGIASDGARGLYVGFTPPGTGTASAPSKSVGVTHFDGNGQLDAAFGTAGSAVATFPNLGGFIALRRGAHTGAIYVFANSDEADKQGSNHYSSTLVRFTPSGQVDTTFGGDGHVQFGGLTGLAAPGFAEDVMERADGSLLVLTDAGFAVLTSGGALTSFMQSPITIADASGNELRIAPLAADSFLVLGNWAKPANGPAAARFTAAEAIDSAYGDQGQSDTNIYKGSSAAPNAVRADGAIVFGGNEAIAAVDANGHPIAGFGTGGVAKVDQAVVSTLPRDDGSVLYLPIASKDPTKMSVRALTPAGASDASFGTAGSFDVPKAVTLADGTTVKSDYVGPMAIVPAGTRRAYLVGLYGANDGPKGAAFNSVYVSRFCVE